MAKVLKKGSKSTKNSTKLFFLLYLHITKFLKSCKKVKSRQKGGKKSVKVAKSSRKVLK